MKAFKIILQQKVSIKGIPNRNANIEFQEGRGILSFTMRKYHKKCIYARLCYGFLNNLINRTIGF